MCIRDRNNTNADSYDGGGVDNGGTFNMYGGSITGNTATGKTSSGGVYSRGGSTFNMSGGSITDNSGVVAGAMYLLGTLNLSGAPTIAGNTANGIENNVYLRNADKTITVVDDGMKASASVGITGIAGNTVVTGTTSATGFFSDNMDYELVNDGNNGLKLSLIHI